MAGRAAAARMALSGMVTGGWEAARCVVAVFLRRGVAGKLAP